MTGRDPSGLLELSERCERATGPDREIDLAIVKAVSDVEGYAAAVALLTDEQGYRTWRNPQFFTASLDAAMTLVPEGWLLQRLFERNASGEWNWRWLAELWRPDDDKSVTGIARKAHDNPAAKSLALCAAALRARASNPTPPSDGDGK